MRSGGPWVAWTRLRTPYVAGIHELAPSGSVVLRAISAPSWVTRTSTPGIGLPPSVLARTCRKFWTVTEERSSVMFTASIRKFVLRDTTWDTLVRRNWLLEFVRVEFTTVAVLFAVKTSARLFRRRAWEIVTFTES